MTIQAKEGRGENTMNAKHRKSRKSTKSRKATKVKKIKILKIYKKNMAAPGKKHMLRQITDTVGIVIKTTDKKGLPSVGSLVHIHVMGQKETFLLRISKVQKCKNHFTIWSWLRKEAQDGARFRACRGEVVKVTWGKRLPRLKLRTRSKETVFPVMDDVGRELVLA